MLSIFLTEELAKVVEKSQDAMLTYYFCDSQDEKRSTAVAILRGLLFQILKKRPELFKHAREEFETKRESLFNNSSLEALWKIFEAVIQDPELGTIYCVLDGLDECEEGSLEVLLKKLKIFFSLARPESSKVGFKLIAVSRELSKWTAGELSGFPRVNLDIESENEVNNDIQRFISAEVKELSKRAGYSVELHKEVENALLEGAEGSFLWVSFVVVELQKKARAEVKDALKGISRGLPAIYHRMLRQIVDIRRDTASLIFLWIVTALRPLTLTELAIATKKTESDTVSQDQAIQDDVELCGPILKIKGHEVILVHQSAKDYLLRERSDNDPILEHFRIKREEANFEVAKFCFDYIHNGAFSNGPVNLKDTLLVEKFPLLNYAALHWPEHARRSSNFVENMFDPLDLFCQTKSLLFEAWWQTYCSMNNIKDAPNSFSQLHLASYFGILPLVRKLLVKKEWKSVLKRRNSASKKDSTGRSPLWYAASNGHDEVAGLLLEYGADLRANDMDDRTQRWTAANNELMVWTPLQWVARYGRVAIWTALYLAAVYGRAATPQLLWMGQTSKADHFISQMADGRHEAMLRILLEKGADVDTKGRGGQTALHPAARYGHEKVVRLLLEKGADINAKDENGQTALHMVVEGRHVARIQEAAEKRHETSERTDETAKKMHGAVIQLLLEKRANIDAKRNDGWTALHQAADRGLNDVTLLLLKMRADIHVKDGDNWTPLHRAAYNGHEAVVQQLLEYKADVEAGDKDRRTALHYAAGKGHGSIVELLLEHNADIETRDKDGRTALQYAAGNGHEDVVRLLLEHKADVEARSYYQRTTLHYAARYGYKDIVGLLLEHNADIEARDKNGRTALHYAAGNENEDVVQQLLEHNADIKARDKNGRTALLTAESERSDLGFQ